MTNKKPISQNIDRIVDLKLQQLSKVHNFGFKRRELGNNVFMIAYTLVHADVGRLGSIMLFSHNYIAKETFGKTVSLESGRLFTQIYKEILLELQRQGERINYDPNSPTLQELEKVAELPLPSKQSQDTAVSSIEQESGDYPPEIFDVQKMKVFYLGYNVNTAKAVIDKLPMAWNLYAHEGGRWGPAFVEKAGGVVRGTASRYLNAFKKAGLTQLNGIELP